MPIVSGLLIASAAVWSVHQADALPVERTQVRYQLSGTGVATYVTYQTDTGQLHATNVSLPWSMEVTRRPTTSPQMLSAQSAGPGSITCTIEVDGKVVSQNTAEGDPARVVCEDHGPPAPVPTTTTAPTEEPGEHPIG